MQMKIKKWCFKIILATMTTILLLPSIAGMTDVLATGTDTIQDWKQYYQRDQNEKIPMPISGATQRGLQFNRPVYQNDHAHSDGAATNSNFSTYINTLITSNGPVNSKQETAASYIVPATTTSPIKSRYPYPLMQTDYSVIDSYLIDQTGTGHSYSYVNKDKPQLNTTTYIAPIPIPFSTEPHLNKDAIVPLTTQAARDNFKTTLENYNIDWNKNGILTMKIDYSMAFKNATQIGFRDKIKNSGLGFNVYFRLPDSYTTSTFNKAIVPGTYYYDYVPPSTQYGDFDETSGSYFKFKVGLSRYNLVFGSVSKKDRGFVLTGDAYNGLTSFQPIDDHFLKFSLTPSNQVDGMTPFDILLKDNGFSDWFSKFPSLMAADVPTELGVRLDMNKLTANGDAFDKTPNKVLTSGRRLPAIAPSQLDQSTFDSTKLGDNLNTPMSPFNATYFMGSEVQDTSIAGKYAYYPVISKITSNYVQPKGAIEGSPDNHTSLITGITGQQSTVHNAGTRTWDGIDVGKNTMPPDYTNKWGTDQYNPNNMDPNGGNALPTWNQYISLYDSKGEYNTQDDKNEPVNTARGLITKNLQGPNALDRKITINSDTDLTKMDMMRFYRSVNYFSKQDTTAATLNDVNWAYKDDVLQKPTQDLAKLNAALKPGGDAKTVFYFGTDQYGNIMSPAKLMINRSKYTLPKITGKTTLSVVGGDKAHQNQTDLKDITVNSVIE